MKPFVLAAAILASAGPAPAAETAVAEISQLQMHSSFWQNLHHFLYVCAWSTRPIVPAMPRLAMPLPQGTAVPMTPEEQNAWDAAVGYYDSNLASRDLLFDDRMTAIKVALANADDTLSGAAIDAGLRATLLSAAPLYRKYWWAAHDASNRMWIAEAARRTAPVAPAIIAKLTALYGVAWFTAPVRVDVVRYGKSLGAYTSINPRPHIVVASADDSYNEWASTEMLFHESSHATLFFGVMTAINGALRAANKDRAGDLWHVVLFYIAGEVTRQRLAIDGIDYRPYLYATGLFARAWPRFQTPVEMHVQAFIDGRETLDQMATALAAAVP